MNLKRIWDKVVKCMVIRERAVVNCGFADESRLLEEARKEWLVAMNIFEEACEPELIEFAVYNLKACEKKYVYLLKRIGEGRNSTDPSCGLQTCDDMK